MAGNNKRAFILEAAAGIVEASGAAHLTIDAVAAAASVSKGGVLYHFPSKQALLEEFESIYLRKLVERFRGNISQSAKSAGLTRYHLRELLKKHSVIGWPAARQHPVC